MTSGYGFNSDDKSIQTGLTFIAVVIASIPDRKNVVTPVLAGGNGIQKVTICDVLLGNYVSVVTGVNGLSYLSTFSSSFWCLISSALRFLNEILPNASCNR